MLFKQGLQVRAVHIELAGKLRDLPALCLQATLQKLPLGRIAGGLLGIRQ